MQKRVKLLVCLLVFVFGGLVQAFSSGPVPGRTGAPGESTCVDCHDSFDLNRGPGQLTLSGLPKTYSPNQRISLKVNISQSKQRRWGFQITALDQNNNAAGQFSITDAANTQLISGNDRRYVEHTASGSHLGSTGGSEWSFDWIAPSTDIGPVTFYLAGNAADGSNSPIGDYIYTTVGLLGAPSDPMVTLDSPNGNEQLQAGQSYQIKWHSTNATAHDLLVQFNGSGDVPTTIVTGLPANVTEFDWTVPNIATTHARIIVVAEGQAGHSDSDSSDRDFTIVANNNPSGPTITSVTVNNSKIKVTGSGFQAGISVAVNGIGFSSPAKVKLAGSQVVQKGTASTGSTINQLIPSGTQVRLTFTNPDGGVSEYNYLRP